MNTDVINDIQTQISEINTRIDDISKEITKFKIDKQLVIKAEKPIKAGIATKVSYSSNGLITSSMPLDSNDIPEIPIAKVTGLNQMIDSFATKNDIKKINKQIETSFEKSISVKSGTKVCIDKNGLVTNVSNLLIEDIPEIPIAKVTGLQERLTAINDLIPNNIPTEDKFNITPGSGIKINWDEKGRIISSSDLSFDDIPKTVIDRITKLEQSMMNTASIDNVRVLQNQMKNKLDTNHSVKSGIYTKVVVDSNGLVTSGTQLSKSDLPEITIDFIPKLRSELDNKATKDDIDNINIRLSKIPTYQSINMNELESKIDSKVDKKEFILIKHQVDSIISELPSKISDASIDQLKQEIRKLNEIVTTLYGRIASIEQNLFDEK